MPGRPLTPTDPTASSAARLGHEVRMRRLAEGLTLAALGVQVGWSPQHLSELERGRTSVTRACVTALDGALGADGALLDLLPAAVCERAFATQARAAARGATIEDVDPINRRGLLGAGAAAALPVLALDTAPTQAREIDPELPEHWTNLLSVLGRHNMMLGHPTVQDVVRRELRVIAEHRAVARGELRAALMRVESCWSEFGAWLAYDSGDRRGRDELLERALRLAREADYPDMLAWARARQAQWVEGPMALRAAEAGLRTPRASAHTRAMCATRAAYAHARIGNAEAVERSIAEADHLVATESRPLPPPDSGMTGLLIRRWEARCWAALHPSKALGMYDDILRAQPRDWTCARGLYLAYLANACADAGELDRARAEGAKALAIARTTKSATATRELKRLGAVLQAA